MAIGTPNAAQEVKLTGEFSPRLSFQSLQERKVTYYPLPVTCAIRYANINIMIQLIVTADASIILHSNDLFY